MSSFQIWTLSAACLWFVTTSLTYDTFEMVRSADESLVFAKNWYVNSNAQKDGQHEVHTTGCHYLKICKHCRYIGTFDTCNDALRAARKNFDKVDGCYYCARECDTDRPKR